MKKEKSIIWASAELYMEGWEEYMDDNYPDITDYSNRLQMISDCNYDELEITRLDLDIKLGVPILVIAELGLWDGNHRAYKEIESGNIADCLYSDTDMTEWFVDKNGDLRADAFHHDGTNHYLYRVWKEYTTEQQKQNLKNKILMGKVTRRDITRATKRLGDYIADVYGIYVPKYNRKEN